MPANGLNPCVNASLLFQLRLLVLVFASNLHRLAVHAAEFKGSQGYNPAQFKEVLLSSLGFIENAPTEGSTATDGKFEQHIFFGTGCATTKWQAKPWLRVDLEHQMPVAVVRLYFRTDSWEHTGEGLQMRLGMHEALERNEVCNDNFKASKRGVTVVNCFAGGRFLFVAAPYTDEGRLSICEIDVVTRGPYRVSEHLGTTARRFDIRIDGLGFSRQDRIRIIKSSSLCGSSAANKMDNNVVARSAPLGEPDEVEPDFVIWKGVVLMTMGFYKVCWCSGMFSCNDGTDFTYISGYAIITGEMRTVSGSGTAPSLELSPYGKTEELKGADVGAVSGLAISEDGKTLYFSEPHRVRMASLEHGTVRTLVGDLNAGTCPPTEPGDVCGDGQHGSMARLNDPRGLAVCDGLLLIADRLNSRIRAYNLTSGIVTTAVGTRHGYFGDGGDPREARLSGPTSVACDRFRGYWISDSNNNAIRAVIPTGVKEEVITVDAEGKETKTFVDGKKIITAIGGNGEGYSLPGSWADRSQLSLPSQLAMSEMEWGTPLSLVYAEEKNAVARFMPLGTRNMEGAVQNILGTGTPGHRVRTQGVTNLQLNGPEGVAVHNSIVFIADTQNHRIVMAPVLEYEVLGCYQEYHYLHDTTLIPPLEGDIEAGLRPGWTCDGEILNQPDAVARCAAATMRKGWDVFAVRCGGVCASAEDASKWYRFNSGSTGCQPGRGGLPGCVSEKCENGRGALDANSVYRLRKAHSKDLIGKFYIISGQAFTTEVNKFSEDPRPGFFGDRISSWTSAVDTPAQMVADKRNRNLFFADRGNKRVRAIFGSLGPEPKNQQFYCTNGLNCTLNVKGNGFSEKDHVALARIYDTSDASGNIVCGRDRLEDQFPQVHNLAVWSRLFLNKFFELQLLALPVVGQFIVCYCIGNAGRDCDITEDYEFKAGRLHVVGPNSGQKIMALAGSPFDVNLVGAGFSDDDRIRLIEATSTCGHQGNVSVNETLPYLRIPGNLSLKIGLGPRDEGGTTFEVWRGFAVDKAVELKVCWCDQGEACIYDGDFLAEAARISVGGPELRTQVVQAGKAFDLLVEGAGGFKAGDRVRLQDAQVPCYEKPLPSESLEGALPTDASPCEVSATSVRWCGVILPPSSPSDVVACWSGASGGFSATNDSGVLAVELTVSLPAVEGEEAGPVMRQSLPQEPRPSEDSWPSRLIEGSYRINVRMYSRSAPGSGSTGPIHVQVCEMPERCLAAVELRELPAGGGLAAGDETISFSGSPFFPRGLLLSSLVTDPYLADFVDVAVDGKWRRFPLNRWLLWQEEDAATAWEALTPPPFPQSPPTRSFYTEGDRCGGCGLGTICRERPLTALELAMQGVTTPSTSTAMTWDCTFACGDGLATGEEQCDDGGLTSFDGCDFACKAEPGFTCDGSWGDRASTCRPFGCGQEPHETNLPGTCSVDSQEQTSLACRRVGTLQTCPLGGSRAAEPRLAASCQSSWLQLGDDYRCEEAEPRPQAVVVQLFDGGRSVILAFDSEMASVNGAALGTELDCAFLFRAATVAELGDAASCVQGSSRHLIVRLGFGADLGASEESASMTVLDIARHFRTLDDPIEVQRPWEQPGQRVFLGPALAEPAGFVVPRVVLQAPSRVGGCGNLVFDASASTGHAGRPWKSIRWRCTGNTQHCSKVLSTMPNGCHLFTSPSPGIATAGLDFGSAACGLLATVPEATVSQLAAENANIMVFLKLENTLGAWVEAPHPVSFSNARMPVAVRRSNQMVVVDTGVDHAIRLEITAEAAMPASSSSSLGSCASLGPVAVEWRVGSSNMRSPEQEWESMNTVPETLQTTFAGKIATLEGVLGSLEIAGTNWTMVARAFHRSGVSESVYVPFTIAVRAQTIGIKLEAPVEVSDSCEFNVVAALSGVQPDHSVSWSCMLLDVATGATASASRCAIAASTYTGASLLVPALDEGAYQIEGTLEAGSRPSAATIVLVRRSAGPRVHILEPEKPFTQATDDAGVFDTGGISTAEVRFSARVDLGSCGSGAYLSAAVVVLSSVPGEIVRSAARPAMALSSQLVYSSSFVRGDDLVQVAVPLSSLPVGLSHSFQLLLAESADAKEALVEYSANLDTSLPASLNVPQGVWAYHSPAVTRVMPPATYAFVEPSQGTATRTLFQIRARAICLEGCKFYFRLAPARNDSVDPNSGEVCDLVTDDSAWQELRPWSFSPEVATPLIAGLWLIEVSSWSVSDNGTMRSCQRVNVTESDAARDIATAGDVNQAVFLLSEWTFDSSRAIVTLREAGQPMAMAEPLLAIASEFPDTKIISSAAPPGSAPALAVQGLHSELCKAVIEAARTFDAAAFLPPAVERRLQAADRGPLEAVAEALLLASRALGPLLDLSGLWLSVDVVNVILDRNLQVGGTLGSDASSVPPASSSMLGLLDLALKTADTIGNMSLSAVERNNCSALADLLMETSVRLGDAVAASGPVDATGAPREVFNADGSVVLSTVSISSPAFKTSGIFVDLTTQTIRDRPYPGLTVPPIDGDRYLDVLKNASVKIKSSAECLGIGATGPLQRLELVVLHWGANPLAIGRRPGGVPTGRELTIFRDVRLRTCGQGVSLGSDALDGQKVVMLTELPEELVENRRAGYGDISPFRCLRWVSVGRGMPGQWDPEGCTSVYRAKGDAAEGEKQGLLEGVLKCECNALFPATWAVEIVPRPDIILEVVPPPNASAKNLVLFGFLILWLPILLPLLLWAALGDFFLGLGGTEAKRMIAEKILPMGADYGGVWGDAEQALASMPWPLRSSFSLALAACLGFLASFCGQRRNRFRDDATLRDFVRYRDAACSARRAGARVTPLDITPQATAESDLQKQEASAPRQVVPSRWRTSAPALPPSSPAAGNSKVQQKDGRQTGRIAEPSQDPLAEPWGTERNRDHDMDALLRLGMDGWDDDTKPAGRQDCMQLSEQDWSQQVRSAVASSGIQQSTASPNALPEGWIARRAASQGGQVYYVNLLSGKSCWEVPALPAVKALSIQEIRELLGHAADHVNLRVELEEMLRPRIAERMSELGLEDVFGHHAEQGSTSQLARAADRQLQAPRLQMRAEGFHRAPPPAALTDSPQEPSSLALRQVGNAPADSTRGMPQPPPDKIAVDADGAFRLPVRFEALAWGPCSLLIRTFARNCPISAALYPRLRPSRLERSAKLAYRLTASLAAAAGLASLQPWAHVPTEAVLAETRPDSELWAELSPAFGLTITLPLGVSCAAAGALLTSLLPAFPAAPKARQAESVGARISWWQQSLKKQHQIEAASLLLAAISAFLALLLAAWAPQPRAAVALAAFFIAAGADIVALPLLRSILETCIIYCASRRCCCGSPMLLVRFPGLLRFAPKGSWTSSKSLIQHAEAVHAEPAAGAQKQ